MLKYIPLWLTVAGIATPASATRFTATYTGLVDSGYSALSYYSSPVGLAGLSYEAIYTFDTSKGMRATSGAIDNLIGGYSIGYDTPVSAVVKIGAWQFVTDGSYFGQERVKEEPGYQSVFSYAEDAFYADYGSRIEASNRKFYNEVTDDLKRIFTLPNITSSLSFSVDQIDAIGTGYFYSNDFTYTDGGVYLNYILFTGTTTINKVVVKSLDPTPIPPTPPPASAVPESDTWAMMILGFGLIGAALRLRRLAAPIGMISV